MATVAVVTALLLRAADGPPAHVRFGFNNNAVAQGIARPDAAASMTAAVGGEIDRVHIDWATLEPRQGELNFEPYDLIYAADLDRGVRPLFIFAFAPPWATDAACASEPAPCHAAPAAAHYADAARTVAAIAARYPRAAGIEIWNEPNAPHFWAPRPDPAAYAHLLAASYDAVKQVAPEMAVVGGSTSNSPGFVAGHIQATDFVASLGAAGAFNYMDALSLHAYPDPSDVSVSSAVEDVREVSAEVPDHLPLWVTETGVSTTGPDAVSETVQALMLRRLSEALPATPGVTMVLIHTLIDPPRGPADRETGFGVFGSDLQAKLSYCVVSEAWGGSASC